MTDTTAATDLLEALEVVTCCLAWHAEYHGTDVDRRVVSAARAVLVNATGRTALGAALARYANPGAERAHSGPVAGGPNSIDSLSDAIRQGPPAPGEFGPAELIAFREGWNRKADLLWSSAALENTRTACRRAWRLTLLVEALLRHGDESIPPSMRGTTEDDVIGAMYALRAALTAGSGPEGAV